MPPATVIRPGTLVNQAECDRLIQALRQAIAQGARHIVIDCQGVEYMNSRALGALIETYKAVCAQGGTLRLAGAGAFVLRAIEAVGIGPLIDVFDSVDEALILSA